MRFRNVTVFGGSGFLGRYLVGRLAEAGLRVRVAVRDPEAAQFLKPMGDVGQVQPMQANIRNEPSVRRAIEGADVVVNTVGILFERGRQRFDAVHARGAGLVAAIAQEAGAARLIHVSAIGADPESPAYNAELRPEDRLILYCGTGGRSALAAKTLIDMGYTDVASLAGGYQAWRSAKAK